MTSPERPDDPDGIADDEFLEAAASAEGDPSVEGAGGPAGQPSDAIDEELASLIDETAGQNATLSAVVAERDQYLDALQRVKAEFDNFKRRTDRERIEAGDNANARLAESLLPVLDACEAALSHGSVDVEPVYKNLIDELSKAGLTAMEPVGEAFDPTLHDAVLHEAGDGDGEPVVVESLRRGYQWKGKVVRPAMVKVRG